MNGMALLHCISEDTRFLILQKIGVEEYSVGEIVEMVRRDQPLVSHHLKILRACGIVTCVSNGRRSMYKISSLRLASLIRDIAKAGEMIDALCTEVCCKSSTLKHASLQTT